MAGYIAGHEKIDVAVAAASSAFTTPYYDMGMYDKVIFITTAGTMGSSEYIELALNQAVTSTGSGAVALGVGATMGSTSGAALNISNAAVAYYTQGATMIDAATVIVNGITFTHKTTSVLGATSGASTGDFDSNRYICTSSAAATTDHQEHLAAYINHATYGCTGILAVTAATGLTLYAIPPGEQVIDMTVSGSSESAIMPLQTVGICEAFSAELSAASSMRYVGLVCTPSVAANVNKMSAVAVRSGARYSPDTVNLVGDYGRTT